MQYKKVVTARFLSRPNRFAAQVLLNGREVSVHVKNTGRCRELLTVGARVYLEDFTDRPGKRKLLYDLIAVEKGQLLINMDAQAPNKAVMEALQNGRLTLPGMGKLTLIRPETVYGKSRFDFYAEDAEGRKGYAEIKGVTLEKDGVVSFPDAPTERGVKHLRELMQAKSDGFCASVIFVVQMEGAMRFCPNDITHKAFGDALRQAAEQGVAVQAYGCRVETDRMILADPIPVLL